MLTIPRRKFALNQCGALVGRTDLQNKSVLVEKIITSPDGIEFKVVFLVYEEGGKIKGKIVSATPLASTAKAETVIALPGKVEAVLHELVRSTFTKESISPYIDFNFFVSQPTRAPNRK